MTIPDWQCGSSFWEDTGIPRPADAPDILCTSRRGHGGDQHTTEHQPGTIYKPYGWPIAVHREIAREIIAELARQGYEVRPVERS